ncbi:MAG TPA: selenide, water dikinase SelD [Planctomycetota bacterium]|nr:selenide, water dikinase SelD [Planctomycetota bacterium]
MGPRDLAQVLRRLPYFEDPNAVVGVETGDDAAVYRSPSGDLIVSTVDFFTPVVDDPYDFGRVAAANSLSDVYAMGGRPLFALSITAWPLKLGLEGLARVLEGAGEVCRQAEAPILGGHSIDDVAPKYGLAVTGVVKPEHLATNKGAAPGDLLYLTKPLGSGAMTGALKKGLLTRDEIREVVDVMTTLNRDAAAAMNAVGAHAATDVTGFGLLGHLQKMMAASESEARVALDRLPVMAAARRLAQAGQVPGGTRRNLEYFGVSAEFGTAATEADRLIAADAQTSGGLLIAVAPDRSAALEDAFASRGVPARRIGDVVEGRPGFVRFA